MSGQLNEILHNLEQLYVPTSEKVMLRSPAANVGVRRTHPPLVGTIQIDRTPLKPPRRSHILRRGGTRCVTSDPSKTDRITRRKIKRGELESRG